MSAKVNVRVNGRRIVTIDPDDREQVERLACLLWPHYSASESAKLRKADITQAALRSLTADPKPVEPQGLGAVVEDAAGTRWIAVDDESARWACRTSRSGLEVRWYADITAVRVLSEGVTQ